MQLNAMVITVLIFSFMSLAHADSPFDEKSYEAPVREISIIATDDGFYPNKVMAFTGEKVKFFITSTSGSKHCFILQKHEVFVAAEKGKINEAHVNLDMPGRFKFYCPSSNYKGHLTVFEKFKQEQDTGREPASLKPKYWTPRDYD
jgi:plastocyanin